MNTDALIELIQTFAIFLKETNSTSQEDFARWILQKQGCIRQDESQLNRDLGYVLNRINRYSKLLAKQYLVDLPIHSLDEFSFLTSIKMLESPSKSDIYEHTLTELATGQQMMRRLIQLGLVEEYEDADDRRVKRVKLTSSGEEVQRQAFACIGEECNFKFKDLDSEDKATALAILQQLLKSLAQHYG